MKQAILATALSLAFTCALPAAEWSCQRIDKKPPAGLAASIQSVLSSQTIQVNRGDTTIYELWFRTDTPLKAKPPSMGENLKSLKETTLIGAAQVGRQERDYRDDELYPGLYTIRFSLQPQDGDHLGTALHPYFAVLTPAKLDTDLNGLGTYKELVKASGKESATGHPFILSLWPVEKNEGTDPRITEPADHHKGLRVTLPAQANNENVSLVFNLIIEGVSIH